MDALSKKFKTGKYSGKTYDEVLNFNPGYMLYLLEHDMIKSPVICAVLSDDLRITNYLGELENLKKKKQEVKALNDIIIIDELGVTDDHYDRKTRWTPTRSIDFSWQENSMNVVFEGFTKKQKNPMMKFRMSPNYILLSRATKALKSLDLDSVGKKFNISCKCTFEMCSDLNAYSGTKYIIGSTVKLNEEVGK